MCGTNQNMEHVYSCKYLNNNQENEISFGRIFNGYLIEQKKIMKIFEENLKRRNELKQNKQSPCDSVRDPLNIFSQSVSLTQYVVLCVRPSVPVSFWRGFVDTTNV